MGDKKDPGKFTIRLNIADPQQQMAVELLNRQGRYKAQFITSAVLLYAYAASDMQAAPMLNGSMIQHILTDLRPAHWETAPGRACINAEGAAAEPETNESSDLGETDLDVIRKTMKAFHTI